MDCRCRYRVVAMNRRAAAATRCALARLGVAFMVLLAPCLAQAHEGAPTSFAAITIDDTRLLYSLTTTSQPLPPADFAGSATGAAPADPPRMANLVARHLRIEADGRRCQPGAADFVPPAPPRLSTTYNIEFRCPAPIRTLRVVDDSFLMVFNAHHEALDVTMPDAQWGARWLRTLDTADAFNEGEAVDAGGTTRVDARSVALFRRTG